MFFNAVYSSELKSKGYVIVNLLDADTCVDLFSIYSELESNNGEDLDAKLQLSQAKHNYEINKKISNEIINKVTAGIDGILCNYKLFPAVFVSKKAHTNHEFTLHRDWSVIDESKYTPLTIWVALQDTTVDNGCLYVIEGSNSILPNIRTASIANHHIDRKKLPGTHTKYLELKKGQAVFFLRNLYHGSTKNKTYNDRIAVMFGATENSADLLFYRMMPNNLMRAYKVDSDFFIKNVENFSDINFAPSAEVASEFVYKNKTIQEKDVIMELYKLSFFEKLKYSLINKCNLF